MLYHNFHDILLRSLRPGADAFDFVPRAVAGRSQDTLLTILRPQVALAIWLRDEPAGCGRSLGVLREGGPFRAVGHGAPEAALDALCEQLPQGTPGTLLTDIFRLATLFGALARSETVRLRLEGITGDACRKFHVDAVGLRMLVTYAGPGTQWVMGDPAAAAAPEQMPRGAVALLRGSHGAGAGVLHRSPPLSHLPEGQRWRLLLCIDEPLRSP